MIKNIGVIGVGGVGGYFGGKLCQTISSSPDVNVYFVARGAHLEAIRRKGLLLQTSGEGTLICKPTRVTDRFDDLPDLDLCLLCVKSFDLREALTGLRGRVSDHTLIVPLLNGVDIHDRVRGAISDGFVFPSCVYIGTHIEGPGRVTQQGGACKIIFGRDPEHREYIPRDLFRRFKKAFIKYEWVDDAYPAIWEKFIFIAAFGLVTACFNKTLGEVMESGELQAHVLGIMGECAALAAGQGIVLPGAIVEDSFEKGRNFPYETKTSFQRDFEQADRPDERDLFGGTLLRLGRSLSLDIPVTRLIYEKLQAMKPVGASPE